MKQNVDFYRFREAFNAMGRMNQFPEGLPALFEYLEEFEEATGEEMELDVIAICCDFWEDTAGEIVDSYGLESLEELEENTTVIYVDDPPKYSDADNREDWENITIIIQNY